MALEATGMNLSMLPMRVCIRAGGSHMASPDSDTPRTYIVGSTKRYIQPVRTTGMPASTQPGAAYRLCAAQYSCHKRSTNAASVYG